MIRHVTLGYLISMTSYCIKTRQNCQGDTLANEGQEVRKQEKAFYADVVARFYLSARRDLHTKCGKDDEFLIVQRHNVFWSHTTRLIDA